MKEERLKEAHDKRSDVFREEVFPEKNAYKTIFFDQRNKLLKIRDIMLL